MTLPKDPVRYRYHGDKVRYVRITYIAAFFTWVILIFAMRIIQTGGFIGGFVLLIPLGLFISAYYSTPYLNRDIEDSMFKANFLSIGLILAVSLFAILEKNYHGDKRQFSLIVIMALVFTMLSLLDIWVPANYTSIVKHLKSIFQTYTVFLLIFALYIYFTNSKGSVLS